MVQNDDTRERITKALNKVGCFGPNLIRECVDAVMAALVSGGGEWTALRELAAAISEARKHTYLPVDIICAHNKVKAEALAAAAPAPPTGLQVGHDQSRGDLCEGNSSGLRTESPSTFSPPPQDGQGAELLGPPRGGSSSDLADSDNQRVGTIDERCYWCDKPTKNGQACTHPELTPDAVKAGFILMGVEFCDHFCCGMPPNICRAVRLAEAIAQPSLPEAVAGNASAPVGEPSATVVSANESAVIPLDKLSEEWDRLDRYYSQLADVAAGAGYDKGSFIGKSIGFSVCAAQLRAALPASSGMGSGQPPGVGEPREALCEALDCIGENIDIAGTEWADRPMKQWMSEWRAALSTPSPTESASSKLNPP